MSEDIPAAPNSAVMVGKYIKCGGVVALITKCNGTDSTITTSQTLSETALDGVAAIVFSDASGASSHVEGDRTTASGKSAHAEGSNTQAEGATAHAEGTSSVASGANAHAEGVQTAAVGYASHAEGNNTKANGSGSHAQGCLTKAEGQYTHASGSQTTAVGYAQSVFGLANVEDTLTTTKAHPLDSGSLKSHYLIVVGNGTLSNYGAVKKRSNAHTLDWDGNAWFAGSVEGTAAILKSTTEGSEKRISITADDNLRLTATDEDGNIRTFGTGYELIETITLDEDMAIVRTEEPDGTPYNFTAVAIRTKKAEGITLGETYLTAHIGESKTQPLYMPQTSSTTEQWTYCEVYQYRGLWERERAQGWSVKNNAETPYQVKLPSFDNLVVEGENIVKISGASVPAGLTIEIWGERA